MKARRAKKFGNMSRKIRAILEVFKEGEKLSGTEIGERLRQQGYRVSDSHVRMFIYHNMLHKYLRKTEINGINYYYPIHLRIRDS